MIETRVTQVERGKAEQKQQPPENEEQPEQFAGQLVAFRGGTLRGVGNDKGYGRNRPYPLHEQGQVVHKGRGWLFATEVFA
ncbi:hypothetical protein DDE01_08120 [Desulfovibrio desulfuricans]|nr:hypothetical protein DDE01_08120 [Desulfovibrio desulfuricans]